METLLVEILSPFLPRLLGRVRETASDLADEAATIAWEHARRLWDRLRPALDQRPAAKEAADDAASAPDDADTRAALRLQLRKLLADDPALAAEIGTLLEAARRDGVGSNLAIGRDVKVKATGHGIAIGAVGHDANIGG